MNIEKSNRLSVDSLLDQKNDIYDFVETYYITIKRNDIGLNELISSFFKSIPKWLKWMLNFRIKMETVDGSKPGYSKGDIIGPFHIFCLINNEVILGINAKHLDYRISLLIERNNSYRLCFSTTITTNNFLGKCHFTFVKTIYRIATPRILQTITRYL